MTNLCLTLDYELFGSGKGDVFQHIIEPTYRLLNICAEHDIKLTIFFEVVEYWKIKENYDKGEHMGYKSNPALAMEEQIRKAHEYGHDIQLHIHPQWIDAKYENEEWVLNMKYWRLPEVPDRVDETISMGLGDLIRKGREEIESILHPVNLDYRCNILRAGGYNIDPSERLLRVLKENDFIADSSVYYGGVANGALSRYNYSSVKDSLPYWYANGSLLSVNASKSDFLEVPVFAQKIRRFKKYDLVRVKSALHNKVHSIEKFKNNSVRKSKFETLKQIFEKEAVTWDFCLFSKSKMKNFLKKARQVQAKSDYKFHPFVLVGHPKDFYYSDAIDYLIQQSKKKKIDFLTMSEMVNRIHQL
ncbi:hypothetical protein GCQ56_04865 [Marinifilum sp. N1E240]|uniref:hypothetical protein n=1 Tax=Marinifilum sp. N1E240 TaxID=2608082 RepID=UPI00128D22E9|nr:hypothetical protein [Marinifilum sp. N1E240]MPQ46333.1 hypothetical protein [Marinifilum sp. N1E240]